VRAQAVENAFFNSLPGADKQVVKMEFRYLLVQQENQICRVTLNRPERLNALNVRIGVELLQALEDCDRSPDVRVVILTGAGRAFCAGDDLRECRRGAEGAVVGGHDDRIGVVQGGFEGNGVGLSIAQPIVERPGGRIWAEATVGKGARFRFTLPR